MRNALRALTGFTALLLIIGCAGSPTSPRPTFPSSESPSSGPPAPTVSMAASAPTTTATAASTPTAPTQVTPSTTPTSYTSPVYGYSLTVPAGWTVIEATEAWGGGDEASSHDVPQADQFVSPGPESAWTLAAPTDQDMHGYVDERIAANAAGHSSTCPPTPDVQDPIDIGGGPGTLLGYNCGILINLAVAVRNGTGYLFGFRDPAVHAATDATDRQTLEGLLSSVVFPPEPFHSDAYGYTVNSPAWSGTAAKTAWDGASSLGDGDPAVDLLVAPQIRAFVYGGPTSLTLEKFADESRRANAEVHPCPVVPKSTTEIEVGGSPALLDTLDCGVFVMTAYVLRDGEATVLGTYGPLSGEPGIRDRFGSLLEAISFDQ